MEIPRCPDGRHKGSIVVRAGWYGRAGQRRQRWLCTPKTAKAHRFTETLPRLVDTRVEVHVCDECATALEPWEGQPAPRLYGFSARDIAFALSQVAAGASYRASAAAVRTAAGRELNTRAGEGSTGRPLAAANEHGQLVSDWVDVFAPVIWAAYAPPSWPDRLLLDETEFRYHRPGNPRGIHAFYVLAAMGYTTRNKLYVAALEAVPTTSIPVWQGFLASLAGQPSRVVTDAGVPAGAARRCWPTGTELRRCEWHIARNLRAGLPDDVRRDPSDRIQGLLGAAQRSVEDWEAYLEELSGRAAQHGYLGALKSAGALDALVRAQAATRHPTGPHSTGPLEEFFHTLNQTIGDRAARMTNKRRADALLSLLAAHRNGWVQEHRWAEIIRAHLIKRRGLAPAQRKHTDPASAKSLR
jgi:hypothetical protein